MFVKSNSSLSSSQPNMKLIPTLEQDCAAWIDADGKYQTTWAGASEFPAQNGRGLRVQCLSAWQQGWQAHSKLEDGRA